MSTFKYNSAGDMFATAELDWATATIKAMLVSAGYGALATHQFVSDVSPGAILVRTDELTNKQTNAGVCRGDIPQLEAFLAGTPAVGLILYADTGDDTTSPLIYYSSDGPGFPFTPAGLNYFIGFDQANGGFFQV